MCNEFVYTRRKIKKNNIKKYGIYIQKYVRAFETRMSILTLIQKREVLGTLYKIIIYNNIIY